MEKKIVLSLFDFTTATALPWAEKGYTVLCVDIQHPKGLRFKQGFPSGGNILTLGTDLMRWHPADLGVKPEEVAFVAAYPPCTDLAVSGARWFKAKAEKNPNFQLDAMNLVYKALEFAEWAEAPYFIENPVSRISTLWRKPDYTFQPHDYTLLAPEDNYTKKTCLWTGQGFVMPEKQRDWALGEPDDRIHKAGPSPERANFRSATPMGFARAVADANAQ